MRNKLQKMEGRRINVTATVSRYGKKSGYRGPEATILLTNIRSEAGKLLTDHVWFTAGKAWDGLKPGDEVTFSARVDDYLKGYQGHRLDMPQEQEIDYHLVYPTKVRCEARDQRQAEMEAWQEQERATRFAAAARNLAIHRAQMNARR